MSVLPSLGIVAAAAEAAGTRLSHQLAANLGGALLGQVTAAATYAANRATPGIILPGIGDLLALRTHDIIDDETYRRYAANHNIGGANGWIWDRMLRLRETYADVDMRRRYMYRSGLDEDGQRAELRRLGIVSNFPYFARPVAKWSPEQVRILDAIGFFGDSLPNIETPNVYENWLKSSGIIRNDDRRAFNALIQVPPHGELLAMLNRQIITETEWHKYLGLNGYTSLPVQNQITRLRYYLPGPSDLIRFAVREAWDPATVNRFGYDREFPAPFRYFAQLQGMDFDPAWDRQYTTGTGASGWDSLYWRVHWENMSPHLGYLAQQRFRATGGPGGGPRNPAAGTWTKADTESLLKIHDYAPGFRRYMAELAYNPLRLIDIRRTVREILAQPDQWDQVVPAWTVDLVGAGAGPNVPPVVNPTADQIALAWATEAHQDRGLARGDAEIAARLDVRAAQSALARAHRANPAAAAVDRQWLATILTSYRDGIMDHASALAALQAAGAHDPAKQLDIVDYKVSAAIGKQQAGRIRTLFTKGKIGKARAEQLLLSAGFTQQRVQQWLRLWSMLLATAPSAASDRDVLDEMAAGTITQQQAIGQLRRLGWSLRNARALVAAAKGAAGVTLVPPL